MVQAYIETFRQNENGAMTGRWNEKVKYLTSGQFSYKNYGFPSLRSFIDSFDNFRTWNLGRDKMFMTYEGPELAVDGQLEYNLCTSEPRSLFPDIQHPNKQNLSNVIIDYNKLWKENLKHTTLHNDNDDNNIDDSNDNDSDDDNDADKYDNNDNDDIDNGKNNDKNNNRDNNEDIDNNGDLERFGGSDTDNSDCDGDGDGNNDTSPALSIPYEQVSSFRSDDIEQMKITRNLERKIQRKERKALNKEIKKEEIRKKGEDEQKKLNNWEKELINHENKDGKKESPEEAYQRRERDLKIKKNQKKTESRSRKRAKLVDDNDLMMIYGNNNNDNINHNNYDVNYNIGTNNNAINYQNDNSVYDYSQTDPTRLAGYSTSGYPTPGYPEHSLSRPGYPVHSVQPGYPDLRHPDNNHKNDFDSHNSSNIEYIQMMNAARLAEHHQHHIPHQDNINFGYPPNPYPNYGVQQYQNDFYQNTNQYSNINYGYPIPQPLHQQPLLPPTNDPNNHPQGRSSTNGINYKNKKSRNK
jgi:hypothetical protein